MVPSRIGTRVLCVGTRPQDTGSCSVAPETCFLMLYLCWYWNILYLLKAITYKDDLQYGNLHRTNTLICAPSRWRSGSRTGALSRRRTRGRTWSCARWSQRPRPPAVCSDCWSRAGCWPLRAWRASCPTAAPPCVPPPWPWPATAAAAVGAARARRGAAPPCPPSAAQGQWPASSPSPCPPYSAAWPTACPLTPCPWPARWRVTCRNFPPATWAPLLLSLTRGPMAKNPWTRRFWNDALFSHRQTPVSSGHILGFFWLSLSLFGFAHSLPSVSVMFCSSSCIPVAHLASYKHKLI